MSKRKFLTVECEPFGSQKLFYPESMTVQPNGIAMLKKLENSWNTYWIPLAESTEELIEDVIGIYGFDASFDESPFEIHIYDRKDWNEPDCVMLRVFFVAEIPRSNWPFFDSNFKGTEIIDAQPSF